MDFPDRGKGAKFLVEAPRADGDLPVKATVVEAVRKRHGVDLLAELSQCRDEDILQRRCIGAEFRDVEARRRHAFRDDPFSLFRAFHQEIEAIAEALNVRN